MEKLMEKSLTPENDLQELWELSGRVKAVLAWAEHDPYTNHDRLIAMLGGIPAQAGAPAQTGIRIPEPVPTANVTEKTSIEIASAEIIASDTQTGGGSNGKD